MCALGTESSLWNERDGNLFWLTKVLSVHQARKKKKVGHGREHFFIKKGDWYVNLIYYKQIHPDTQLHFRVGQRGLTLCESLLIYPRTGDISDIRFNTDTLQLHHETCDYTKSNSDLLSYKDPVSK